MMDAWTLPMCATIGQNQYVIHADYRDVLDILQRLGDEETPTYIRWGTALALFYEPTIPASDRTEATRWMCDFFICGQQPDTGRQTTPVIDWQRDAQIIVADVNKVAGCEIRALPFLHWWTFMAYFNAVGEGQLATLIRVRSKLRQGKKLEAWERDYYRENKALVDAKRPFTPEEKAERERLRQLLGK